jgi:hypothetical protein
MRIIERNDVKANHRNAVAETLRREVAIFPA